MAADWREESLANTCLKVFRQTLPLGSRLYLPLLFGLQSMTAVGCDDGSKMMCKVFQHITFCISHFVHGTEGRDTESCMQMGNPHKSTSEVPDK